MFSILLVIFFGGWVISKLAKSETVKAKFLFKVTDKIYRK